MAATIKELGDLHSKLTRTISEAIEPTISVVGEGEGAKEVRIAAPASMLAVAVAFLKNNSITADADVNDELTALKDKLKERRAQRKAPLTARDLDEAAEVLGTLGTGTMQ